MAKPPGQVLMPQQAAPQPLDRESSFRTLRGAWASAVLFGSVGLAAFQLYTAATLPLAPQLQRSIHLGLGLGLLVSAISGSNPRRIAPNAAVV